MKCPLFYAQELDSERNYPISLNDCLKEECAWWDESQGRCAIKEIALCLEYISTDIIQLFEKIPYEGQFGK